MKSTSMLLLVAGMILCAPLRAEVAYVTDMLQLDMYGTADMLGSPIQKLRSGDKVDVIERNGRYARVKSDSGREGWVKGLYLVDKEPARTRLNSLERSNEGLERTVKKLRSQLAAEQQKVAGLEESQSGEAQERAATEAELEQLRSENASLQSKLSSYSMSVPLNWSLIAAAITLLCGFVGGWYIIDKRSRARHGGFRIY